MQNEMFEPPKTADVSMLDKVKEVEREIGFRQGVYTRQVAAGKMQQSVADRRILVMQAVLEDMLRLMQQENDAQAEQGKGIRLDL